jgi:hypothetical protein
MSDNTTLFIHLFSSILLGFTIIWALVNRNNYKKEKQENEENEYELKKLHIEAEKTYSTLLQAEKKIVELLDKNSLLNKEVQTAKIENAGLESANKVLKLENAKLLKAASDDITINVKAMDDAKIIAENPKPKRRYFKKSKKNTGSNKSEK